jgi:2-phospho-L-lactate guanylyltransferase
VSGCWVVIPVRTPGQGKTRLAAVLDPRERERLVTAMLHRVVTAAGACADVARICLVGPRRQGLPDDALWIEDGGTGLNDAVEQALRQIDGGSAAPGSRPDRVIVVPADLPQLAPVDLAMLAQVPQRVIAIAPDRHGTGTNALSLPASALGRFPLRFGSGSHAAHRFEAQRLGYSVETMLSDGLEKDIDEPRDLADVDGNLQQAW